MKRVLVTGSRIWDDWEVLQHALQDLLLEHGEYVLVHGGARGVDQHAARYARVVLGLPAEEHLAQWDEYGKRAGYVRNAEMVQAGADICVAFIKDRSRGATMCADLAEKAGIPTRRWTA
jgi:hypothetical protein